MIVSSSAAALAYFPLLFDSIIMVGHKYQLEDSDILLTAPVALSVLAPF